MTIPFYAHSRVAALLAATARLLTGCSTLVTPAPVPMIQENVQSPLQGITVGIVSAEQGAGEQEILTDGGAKTGLRCSRTAWTRILVEAMARELSRRGARVKSTAPLVLRVALPEIHAATPGDFYQVRVKAAIASSQGWLRQYEGIGGMKASQAPDIADEADTIAGHALAAAVKAMLDDPEFLTQMTTGQ